MSPSNWSAYSTHSLAQLLQVIIESYRDVDNKQGVIFVSHSMGCSLAAMLASTASSGEDSLHQYTVGFIAMCPRAEPLPPIQEAKTKKLLRIPSLAFDLVRRMDRKSLDLNVLIYVLDPC